MKYRPHRYPTHFPVTVRTATGPQKGTVLDVNAAGARLAGLRNLRRGDKLQLEVLSQRIEATVQWANMNLVGVIFRPQISGRMLDTLRYRRDGRIGRPGGTVGFADLQPRHFVGASGSSIRYF